ncbi:DUF2470 domain-containing protein [Micromonospora carbonacea]|uniref:DUF2470 domain-containing protein n=1 Tax=Micromonospora carbonacea TaxID=47853 RepID=A0A7H8XKJ7_9ACTN|nr:DUF2470 domain-containing protein [Micromonospora carbonacea]MBB5826811.1 hypothetical protein [Micromonospora carbonacea]QLD25334.1 DUF2470 domain-containing protein [Micromonospora carbonacea]
MSGNIPPATVAVAAGTPAERLRTLLVAADSVTLLTPTHRAELTGRHRVGPDGRLRVELPADSGAARELAREGDLPAVVHAADLAPVPMPDRVRGRATLTGWLTVEGLRGRRPDLVAVLHLATAGITDTGGTTPVDPDAFATARPDPLAPAETELLRRLATDASTVEQLTGLVPARLRPADARIHLLRLDRAGIVLRVQAPAGSTARAHDVRLPFARPLRDPDQLDARLDALLGRPPRRALRTRG